MTITKEALMAEWSSFEGFERKSESAGRNYEGTGRDSYTETATTLKRAGKVLKGRRKGHQKKPKRASKELEL